MEAVADVQPSLTLLARRESEGGDRAASCSHRETGRRVLPSAPHFATLAASIELLIASIEKDGRDRER
jgi:hypothetical protein